MSRSLHVSGRTCHSAAFFSHRLRDRNLPPSHKSNMVSIVATQSWRPRWVMGCRSDYVGSTSGVPEIADELIAPRNSAEAGKGTVRSSV
jgi:hypothetical protein